MTEKWKKTSRKNDIKYGLSIYLVHEQAIERSCSYQNYKEKKPHAS